MVAPGKVNYHFILSAVTRNSCIGLTFHVALSMLCLHPLKWRHAGCAAAGRVATSRAAPSRQRRIGWQRIGSGGSGRMGGGGGGGLTSERSPPPHRCCPRRWRCCRLRRRRGPAGPRLPSPPARLAVSARTCKLRRIDVHAHAHSTCALRSAHARTRSLSLARARRAFMHGCVLGALTRAGTRKQRACGLGQHQGEHRGMGL